MGTNVHALELTRSPHGVGKPDRAEVEAAVRTIIRWSGDNPDRDGLIETPARVTRALEESFVGYAQDPAAILQKSFDEIEGYDEMIVLRGVRFESHCEHHMAPICGPGVGGLRSQWPCGRHQQARARGRDLCQAPADPGTADGANRQHDRTMCSSRAASASSSGRRITA